MISQWGKYEEPYFLQDDPAPSTMFVRGLSGISLLGGLVVEV
jgi:hypothetical protein